jgi:hypothetical protein
LAACAAARQSRHPAAAGGALLVLAPHAGAPAAWVSALCAATLGCGAPRSPCKGTRMPPGCCCCRWRWPPWPACTHSYHTLLGRDAGVAMLVLLVAFKMLEMRARRDLFVVVFLCFFLVLTNFFYSQGIGTALLMLPRCGPAHRPAELPVHRRGAAAAPSACC